MTEIVKMKFDILDYVISEEFTVDGFADKLNELTNLASSDKNKSKHCTYEHPPFDPDKCEKYSDGCAGCIHNKENKNNCNETEKEE